MRTIILATTAALIMSVQMAATAKAEDTTVIKKDVPEDSTTVIKKRDDVNLLPVPHHGREEGHHPQRSRRIRGFIVWKFDVQNGFAQWAGPFLFPRM